MLEPKDFQELTPKFEAIRQLLSDAGTVSDSDGMSDEACGYYILALGQMENIVREVEKKQGHSMIDALKRAANTPEGAGVIGGVAAGASVPAFVTGLGGFGVVAGGTGFGVAGLAGAAAATGGAALAGAAGAYLAYKGGSMALETELGQKAKAHAVATGKETVKQARAVGRGMRKGLGRVRGPRNKPSEE